MLIVVIFHVITSIVVVAENGTEHKLAFHMDNFIQCGLVLLY